LKKKIDMGRRTLRKSRDPERRLRMLFWTDSIKELEVLAGLLLAFCWISRYIRLFQGYGTKEELLVIVRLEKMRYGSSVNKKAPMDDARNTYVVGSGHTLDFNADEAKPW
jgi:hypothetical protein